MSQLSFPWPKTDPQIGDGREYTAAEWDEYFEAVYTGMRSDSEGVLRCWDELAVTSPGANQLQVGTGKAIVKGKYYSNNAIVTLAPVSAPTGTTRKDSVILECDWTGGGVGQYTVRLAYKQGSAADYPAMTQVDDSIWQLRLYNYTINDVGTISGITDMRVWCHYGSMVSTEMLDDDAVTTAKVADGAVTAAKVAADVATQTEVDAVQTNLNTHKNASTLDHPNGSVTTAKVANDAIDDTKVGNRVPQLYRRQGGSSTDWSVVGTTNYTPGAVRIQCGAIQIGVGGIEITFPVAFSAPPIIVAIARHSLQAAGHYVKAVSVSSTKALLVSYDSTGNVAAMDSYWIAIGPE